MTSLRNLMEDNQLDFNQPLLSVRRFSSTGTPSETKEKTSTEPKIPPLPVYKSELKSGPVRNPGTVPFVWEQTPGKPKDESTRKTRILTQPPLVPKLPPGRVPNVKQEVPISMNASSDENAREAGEDKAICESGIEEEEEDDDEVFRDANDRFSRSESFFFNCSISGVSGLEGSEIKPSGASSMDPQARNFMIDRFLPAAKAMASETPPHTTRKQTTTVERPREIKMVTNGGRQSRPNLHLQTHHVQEICREESDDEDDVYYGSGYASARGCGLLPRFCLKGSFVLLNPVPGLRMQGTSVRKIRNSSIGNPKDAANERRVSNGQGITRLQMEEDASKSSKSNGKTFNQERDTFSLYRNLQGEGISNYPYELSRAVHTNVNPYLGWTENATNSATNEYDEPHRRSLSSFQALLGDDESGSASPAVEKTLYIDSVHKIRSPNSSSNSWDMKGISFSSDMIDDASMKSTEMKEPYLLDSATQDIKKLNAADEKTNLKPDSLVSVGSHLPTSSDRTFFEVKVDSNYSRFKLGQNQDAVKLTSLQFAQNKNKKFDLENQFPLKPNNRVDSNCIASDTPALVSSDGTHNEKIIDRKQPEKSSYEGNNLIIPDYGKKLESDGKMLMETGIQESFHSPAEDSPDLRTSEDATNGNRDSKNKILKREGNEGSSRCGYSRLSFAPPPPKSPSDSWLKRTLPTSRNSSFLQSSLAMRANPVSITTLPDPKSESIVKSSDTNHQHLQFPKELLSSIPEV